MSNTTLVSSTKPRGVGDVGSESSARSNMVAQRIDYRGSNVPGNELTAAPCHLVTPNDSVQMESVRQIFREYAGEIGIDLCFQDFESELSRLPGEYASPRGTLMLAMVNGEVAGCCGLRPLDSASLSNVAELKRLYVRSAFRRLGLGRHLVRAILDAAHRIGYESVVLDTLDDMRAARAMYEDLGFGETSPYYHNPLPGVHYLRLDLIPRASRSTA